MAQQSNRRVLAVAAVATLLGTALAPASAPASASAPPSPAAAAARHASGSTGPAAAPSAQLISQKLGSLATATGVQTVFVQLSGSGAAAVSSATLRTATGSTAHRRAAAKTAALARRSAVTKAAGSVFAFAHAADRSAAQLYDTTNGVPGVAMTVDASTLASLATRPDVVRISAIIPQTLSDAGTEELTKVLDTWTDPDGNTGAGVTVGVIDSGIDYTHADFGGPGTSAAYQTALASADNRLAPWYSTLTPLAQAKIAGGFDFAGDSYDPDSSIAADQVPRPDPNPLDCSGHGTHVAGILAGYGENADGSTFTGDYTSLAAADVDAMKIAPGVAPNAEIYSLKVFGCQGPTDLVMEALDAALDPNGDGDFSDHLDIVNLSLGGNYTTVDDPENAEIDTLAENGVLPVIADGNDGDLTDAGGAPGNAVRALDVASSVDASQLEDGLQIDAPTGLVSGDVAAGQYSTSYSFTADPTPVTGAVVMVPSDAGVDPVTGDTDGCEPFSTAQKGVISGQVVWLTVNDASPHCTSSVSAAHVQAAGGIGVIIPTTQAIFATPITGDSRLPMFQLDAADSQALEPAAADGTLTVTFDGSLADSVDTSTPSITDTLSTFSSRGTHGSLGVVKPDVTAPGDTVASAGMGTGDGVLVESGTSMAAPHTAGIAALVRFAHPDWTVEQVKAAIMNTADHDVYSGENQTDPIYGPARVGAGRVDALDAVTTNLLAYQDDNDLTDDPADEAGGVSASFGVVEAPINQATVTETRMVTVQNTGLTDAAATVTYDPIDAQPGVAYSVEPPDLAIPAGSSVDVTVTMTITTGQLRHTIDPTMSVDQTVGSSSQPRQFVSDASGRLLISQTGRDDLRVPVYGAAKPVSTITATANPSTPATVSLSGSGFAEGSAPNDYNSLMSVMDLGATSPQLPACSAGVTAADGCTFNATTRAADIQYVGAGSATWDGTLAGGWLWFGVSTYGNNATIGDTTHPFVDIWVDGHNPATTNPDYLVEVQNQPGTDVLVAATYQLPPTGAPVALDAEPLNFEYGDVDTNVFDSNTILIPVEPSFIGLQDGEPYPISYKVGELSSYGSPLDNDVIDSVGPISYDVAQPAVGVQTSGFLSPDLIGPPAVTVPLYADQGGRSYPFGVTQPNTQALVLHLDNQSGTRAQVLTLGPPLPGAPTGLTATAATRSAVVRWTAPTATGGQSVTGYNVQYSTSPTGPWTPASSAFNTNPATAETVTGLAAGSTYYFRVAAINGNGTGSYAAPTSAVKITDPSALTGGGAVTITYGSTTTLTGHLSDTATGSVAVAGSPVGLWGRALPSGTYALVTTGTTSTAGLVSAAVKPLAGEQYQWRFAGSAAHAAATAAAQTITVTQIVNLALTPTTVKHGVVFKPYGTISPFLAGQSVVLQQLEGSTWVTVKTIKTANQTLPNGKSEVGFASTLTESKAATYSFRAVWTGVSGRATGTSTTMKVKVT